MKLSEFATYYPALTSDLECYRKGNMNDINSNWFYWFYPTADNKSIFRGGCTLSIDQSINADAFIDNRSNEVVFLGPKAFRKIPRKIYKQSIYIWGKE